MSTTSELHDLIRTGLGDAVPFARHAGVELAEVADGAGRAVLRASPEVLNHLGTLHAGALFTLAETASGAAMAGAFAERLLELRPVVSDATVTYRRPAKGTVTAIATTDRPGDALRSELAAAGRSAFRVAVSLSDERGREVASLDVRWVVSAPA